MPSKYSEYSRLRDIAVKRIGRISGAGLAAQIHIPTVKELKAMGVSAAQATERLTTFVSANPTTLREFRKQEPAARKALEKSNVQFQEEKRKAKSRESSRRYRERIRSLTKKERSYIKAAKTLGLRITPSQAKAFGEYMEFRFAQGTDSLKYRISNYVDDFRDVMKKKDYTPTEIKKDFDQFLLDREGMLQRFFGDSQYTTNIGDSLFQSFMNHVFSL